ncbi:MAG: 3-oxoacyl-[acyl-carrier-protein] reductase [Thermodesulfobacteriota bacterium]|nr:3-oxoacyl-[acyl-carrier-protein] reductase [Thermodesulfobacteriota bacterium]
MRLEGKVAVVTGAGQGLGRACAECMAAEGAKVVVSDMNAESGEAVAAAIRDSGGEATFIACDVGDKAQVTALIAGAVAAFGRLDSVVANAGIVNFSDFLDLSEEDFDAVLRTNLKGTFLLTKAVSRPMMKQRNGRIVNLSSVVGQMGNAGQSNYSAAKAGIIGFTKSMARELASRGVTVNAIAPGFIMTAMTAALPENVRQGFLDQIPMGKFGTPEDVAELAVFLASEGASYVTGQVIGINGGLYM